MGVPERQAYDEFGLFHENAAEYGLPYDGPPEVRRVDVEVSPGRAVSSLLWGNGPPELVLVHGGAQNAHTWDTVALALGRPLLAVDLPGHGHSDGGPEGSISPPMPVGSSVCRWAACPHWPLRPTRPSSCARSSSSMSRPA